MRGAKGKDLTGSRFGMLIAIRDVGSENHRRMWLFKCDCGKEVIRAGAIMSAGEKKNRIASCGCALSEIRAGNGRKNKTHGKSQTRLYGVWRQMFNRCENPRCKDYPAYGGRGILACREWEDISVFFQWAFASGYNDSLTIERINVNDGYHPLNCTWTANENQAKNTRKLRMISFEGRTAHASEWARILGVPSPTIRSRIRYGWTDAEIITGVRA